MKKILVTGNGTSGSWQIRGVELGFAIDADVVPRAQNFRGYDGIILVKRASEDLLQRIHASGVPLVWDIVDSWPQPVGNQWNEEQARSWLSERLAIVKPHAVVAATNFMTIDVDASTPKVSIPAKTIWHHARPKQERNPIREEIAVVGYEGSDQYMRELGPRIAHACDVMGFKFVMNPTKLSDLDVIVAMRDDRGYAVQNWKSNVKLANAQATGTPCILNRDRGYVYKSSGGELYADSIDELVCALNYLKPQDTRQHLSNLLRRVDNQLDTVAAEYKLWLDAL